LPNNLPFASHGGQNELLGLLRDAIPASLEDLPLTDTWKDVSFHDQIKSARPLAFLGLFLAWSLIGILSFARFYFLTIETGPPPQLWSLLVWLCCFYPWVLLGPLVFRMEGRFPLCRGSRGLRNLLILALLGIPLSLFTFELRIVLAIAFEYLLRAPIDESLIPLWKIPMVEFCYHQIPYWVTIGASYILRHFGQLRERERETARLALEKAQLESTLRLAELEALRMKLNPHFLFNALQNISVLALQNPRAATVMLSRLGDLLRASFRKDAQPEIPLQAEIALTQAYLDIERVRFRDRLSVLVDISPGTESALVPTFLLQPLVENAIKHGLAASNISGRIQIRSLLQPDRLVLTVADNGSGISADSVQDLQMGVGLGSTFERLNRLYPDQHEFTVQNVHEGGTEVRIALPYHVHRFPAGSSHADVASLHR
jgi:two-component system, LytTR family, sensor kinase